MKPTTNIDLIAALLGDLMQFAILTGLYQQPLNMSSYCPTGNCAWRNITTLAVCGSCSNHTSQIQVSCPGSISDSRLSFGCNYTFPSGTILQASVGRGARNGTLSSTQWNSTAQNLTNDLRSGEIPRLATFEAIKLPLSMRSDNLPPPTAFSCSLDFCTKTWPSVLVVNGSLQSPLPEEEPLFFYSGRVTNTKALPEKAFWQMSNRKSGGTADDAFYAVNRADYANLVAYLQQLFTLGWFNTGRSTRPSEENVVVPDVGRPLALDSNLTAIIQDVANTMTESIRISTGSVAQDGQSIVARTYIKVQWGWLALPIVLTSLTTVLLIKTIVETYRSRALTWKSSGVFLLFCRLGELALPNKALRTEEEFEEITKRKMMRLVECENSYMFVEEKIN